MRNLKLLLLLSLAALMLAGCGSEPAGETTIATIATEATAPPPSSLPENAIRLGSAIVTMENNTLDLTGIGVSVADLLENLGDLPGLQQVIMTDVVLPADRQQTLLSAFPEITFQWKVKAGGKTFLSTDTVLSFAGEAVDVQALCGSAPLFYDVQELDLTGCGVSTEDIAALREAFGGAFVRSEITVCGQTFTTDAVEIDLSGIPMTDTAEVEQAVALMPDLQKVLMIDCGFTNEEMDALNKRHEDVLFVWTVSFSVYTLRTDATAFCASNVPQLGYIAPKLGDADLEPLKYCTELEALDLGHMRYSDLSFLENMPKLRYLILVEAKYTDISAIASLKNLYYLELFNNTIYDLSPLLECTSLKHLNIGYTREHDSAGILMQMTWLERLWFPGNSLTRDQINEITAALPNTQCYFVVNDGKGSTGGGWRDGDVYTEMRDFFGMFYQPGGTGVKS